MIFGFRRFRFRFEEFGGKTTRVTISFLNETKGDCNVSTYEELHQIFRNEKNFDYSKLGSM